MKKTLLFGTIIGAAIALGGCGGADSGPDAGAAENAAVIEDQASTDETADTSAQSEAPAKEESTEEPEVETPEPEETKISGYEYHCNDLGINIPDECVINYIFKEDNEDGSSTVNEILLDYNDTTVIMDFTNQSSFVSIYADYEATDDNPYPLTDTPVMIQTSNFTEYETTSVDPYGDIKLYSAEEEYPVLVSVENNTYDTGRIQYELAEIRSMPSIRLTYKSEESKHLLSELIPQMLAYDDSVEEPLSLVPDRDPVTANEGDYKFRMKDVSGNVCFGINVPEGFDARMDDNYIEFGDLEKYSDGSEKMVMADLYIFISNSKPLDESFDYAKNCFRKYVYEGNLYDDSAKKDMIQSMIPEEDIQTKWGTVHIYTCNLEYRSIYYDSYTGGWNGIRSGYNQIGIIHNEAGDVLLMNIDDKHTLAEYLEIIGVK